MAEPATAEAAPDTATGGGRLVPIAVASALFMEFIDSTALSTALPTLASAFGSDPVHLKLALTSYLLALAVFAPASGWVSDRYGARRVFIAAMAVFLVGSIACGLSTSLGGLIAARLLQGLGGAMMTPVGRLIVVGSTPKARLIIAMGWFTTPALIGPLIGPPLAGFVLSVADWPWIFFINVPVGILGMIAVGRFVPELRGTERVRFDIVGFLLAALAISAVVVSSEVAGLSLVSNAVLAGLVLTATAAGVLYVRHARRVANPVLDVGLLRFATVRASLVGGTLARLGLGASPFLLPMLLQSGFGWSPGKAGLVTIAGGLGALSARSFMPLLLRHAGFRAVLVATVIATAVLTAIPAAFAIDTPIIAIVLALFLAGLARAAQFTTSGTVLYAEVPQASVSAAATLSTVAQQVGMSLGISVGGVLLHFSRATEGTVQAGDFAVPFIVIGLITLLAVPIYARLHGAAGREISGHRPR